uniref:Uncharacterized protein n=1 Tax=Anguilla anguilla TaxID=7936 RepID=A0A0E9SJL6_ANGAN
MIHSEYIFADSNNHSHPGHVTKVQSCDLSS